MAISARDEQDLRDWVWSKACGEFRRGQPCIPRNNTQMVGDVHEPCLEVGRMMAIIDTI